MTWVSESLFNYMNWYQKYKKYCFGLCSYIMYMKCVFASDHIITVLYYQINKTVMHWALWLVLTCIFSSCKMVMRIFRYTNIHTQSTIEVSMLQKLLACLGVLEVNLLWTVNHFALSTIDEMFFWMSRYIDKCRIKQWKTKFWYFFCFPECWISCY